MCRLWAVSYGGSEERIPLKDIASILFFSLHHGGKDAYGWMKFDGRQVVYQKRQGSVMNDLGTVREHMAGGADWVVGHVRAATHGSPDVDSNNHPIIHGNVIGVHNGVLRNHQSVLSITGREHKEADVDSEAIFAAVNKWGHAQGISLIDGHLVAIYASLLRPRRLHVVRSEGRSLHIGWTDRGNIIMASEREALYELEYEGIRFERLSVLGSYRRLIIQDGRIIRRHSYRTPPVGSEMRFPARSSFGGYLVEAERKEAVGAED